MRALRIAFLGAAGLAVSVASASAADVLLPVTVVTAPSAVAPPPTTLSAYVELFGGHFRFRDSEGEEVDDIGRGWGFGGLGKAAWNASPSFTLQFDVWGEHWSGQILDCEQCFLDQNLLGIATHLIFGSPGGFQYGAMASIGRGDFGTHVNVAGEAAFSTDGMRVGVQGGYSFGIGGYGQFWQPRTAYAQAIAAFYLGPNLAVSANFGVSHYKELNDPDYTWRGINWGARVEFQPGEAPFSIFAAYQGERRNWTEFGDVDKSHFIGIGVGLLVGQQDLRGRDAAVGFGDYNPLFGPTFRR